MRVSIVVPDDMVIVDRTIGLKVDCASLDNGNIHAIQWYETWGEIEYKTEYLPDHQRWHRQPNKRFEDFRPFQSYVDAWRKAKDEYDAAQAKLKQEFEENMRKAKEMEQQAREEMARLQAGLLPPPST
jgi:hypothetical protein